MKTKMKTKKNAALLILALLLPILCSLLISCEKPEICGLVEKLLGDGGIYAFSASLAVQIENNPSGAIPNEMIFTIEGQAKGGDAEIYVALVEAEGEEVEFAANLHKRGDILCFELNELSKIIADLLCSTGLVDMAVKELFDTMAGYSGDVMYVELENLDLEWFERYGGEFSDKFRIISGVEYEQLENVEIPELEWVDGLSFSKVKASIEKELLKLPYYRHVALHVVLETAEDGENYINVLATRENGERKVLEKRKIDSDLSQVQKNPESVYSENILPMRYLMELLGETVGWEDAKKTAYILNGGNKLYFEGELINSTAYIPLNHIIARTDYIVNSVIAGEYIEFKIFRR